MIHCSVITYALAKDLGKDGALAEFNRQLADPHGDATLPCVRVIHRLRTLDTVAICHDLGGTYIGKARSRAFFNCFDKHPDADVWLSCDDDVEATADTLRHLVEACRSSEGLVLTPCVTRESNVVNVALEPGMAIHRQLKTGGETVKALAGGFGLVAMHRTAMEKMVDAYKQLGFWDADGEYKYALFLEEIDEEASWLGEDVSFCRRAARAGIRIEALVTGITSHAGQVLQLEHVPELAVVVTRGPVA